MPSSVPLGLLAGDGHGKEALEQRHLNRKLELGEKLRNLILNLGALGEGKLQQHSMHSAKSRHPNAIKAREQETIILEDDDVDEVFGFYEFVIQS